MTHDEGPRRLILIVEDDDHARELLRMMLEQLGHRVVEAANGVTGVALALTDRPGIAFVDVDLPELNGHEVARRIRSNQDVQHIYLVALTGRGRERDRLQSREAGFDEHMTKPIDLERLAGVLAARPAGQAA